MQKKYGLVVGMGAALVLGSLALAACGSDETEGAGGGGGGSINCWPPQGTCGLASGAGSECVAWHDNAGGTKMTFRMSQLEVVKPTVLAGEFLQDFVVSKGISLNRPECYQEGTGRFTWLMELDKGTMKAKTGGAHVQIDPSVGYCYIDEEVEGFHPKPVEIGLKEETNGSLTFTETLPDMTVAIFLTDDESSAIILPLHEVMMQGLTISADGNCIGRWAGDELDFDNNCKPDRNLNQKTQWISGANLTGYIQIDEADEVWIPEMTQTLCVALSGSAITYGEDFEDGDRKGKRCLRENGVIKAAEKADWCASTNAACSPPEADSFRLEGTFAASAVKILDTCP